MTVTAALKKMKAVWEEVQGACDAVRLQRALDAGADRQLVLDGWTPLHYVCENRSVEDAARAATIRLLTQAGFDANAVDENGWTALHLLSKNKHSDGHSQSIAALVAGKANAALATKDSNKLALHLLCENEGVSAESLSVLVKATSNINAIDADGNAPLHYLTENGSLSPALLTVMMAARAKPDIQNQFQSTPFHNLCQHSGISVALVQLMLQHKANPNVANNIGNSAFHYACENYSLTVDILTAFLNSKQVDLTTTNSLGKTALELIPSHKRDCLEVAQKVGGPSIGAAGSLSSAKEAAIAGGEDASELPPALAQQLNNWNTSLPPFDMAFYNAVSCEQAFATLYEHVQNVSAQACESPSDSASLAAWTQALAQWRGQLVLAFVSLVPPDLWDSYASKFNRRVPSDVAKSRSVVVGVWTRYPTPAHRRQRLEELSSVFPVPK